MKTISLELAKSISAVAKEKEVELSESDRYWNEGLSTKFVVEGTHMADWMTKPYIPAYTTDELLEILKDYLYEITVAFRGWEVVYLISHERGVRNIKTCFDHDITKALGEMFLYLLENDLYKPNQ